MGTTLNANFETRRDAGMTVAIDDPARVATIGETDREFAVAAVNEA